MERENEFNHAQSEENIFGEEGKPVTYDSNTPARPLRHYVQIFKQTQKTPELTYAINPFYHVYQPRVYGYAQVVYQKSPKTWGYYANSAGVVHAVTKREAEAEPEAEADAQYYNWNQGYNGYSRMSYGYNRWNNGYSGYGYNRWNNGYSGYGYNRYNNYNSYTRYNSFNGYYRY